MATTNIKQIQLSDGAHELDAKYWNGHEWSELAHAIKFIGEGTTTAPTAGNYKKATVTVGGTTTTYYISITSTGTATEIAAELGDVFVVTSTGKEYICTVAGASTASTWTELGDESSYALKSVAGKAGTYTTTGKELTTGEEAAYNASVTISSIKYDKADSATGSAGAHTHSVTTHAHGTAVTAITGYPNFSGGSISGATPVTVVTGIKGGTASGTVTVNKSYTHTDPTFGTTDVVTGYSSFSGGSLSGETTFNTDAIKAVSLSASTTSSDGPAYVASVTHTAASLTGTTTFNTDAIKSVSLAASTTSTDGPTYVESVTHTAASLTGTTTFVTGYGSFSGGSFTQGAKASFTQGSKASFTQGTKASLSYTARSNVMSAPTVSSAGVLSWTLVDADDITAWSTNGSDSFTANGNDTFTANGTDTFTAASLGTASTASVGISGGSITPVTKYMKASTTAASTASVGISGGSITPVTRYMKVGTTAATSKTVTFTAAALGTADTTAAYTSISKAGGITSGGTSTVVTGVTAAAVDSTVSVVPSYSHTAASLGTPSTGTAAGATSTATLTTSETGAHTHSVTTTSTAVTGSATAAILKHSHSIASHTHNVTISNCA